MTLRRTMVLQIAVLILALLALGLAAVWGLNGLKQDFGVALRGYEEVRWLYEIGSHVVRAKESMATGGRESDRANFELRSAAEKLELLRSTDATLLGARTHATQAENEIGQSLTSALASSDDAHRLQEMDRSLGLIANLASEIRASIAAKQLAAEQKHRSTMLTMSILTLLVAAGAIVISIRQYRSVMKPFAKLTTGVQSLARGELSQRVDPEGPAEFSQLATHFNQMGEQLQSLYNNLESRVASQSKELVQSEKLAGVGYLAAGVAHEINNPLGIIAGHAELTLAGVKKQSASSEEIEKTLSIVRDEAFRCKSIIQRLLQMARSEESKTSVNLADMVADVAEMVQGLHRFDRVRLAIETEQEDDCVVLASEGEMKQMALNLIINAMEASPAPGGVVTARVAPSGAAIVLSITDQGRGMSPATLARVFEPFFTLPENATGQDDTKSPRGVGLGLSITHAIVQNHGGTLEAFSEGPGRGSRFVVRLPRAKEKSV